MLRTANEMKAETQEAIEQELMKSINIAASAKYYEAVVPEDMVPWWLAKKLATYGYKLIHDAELELITINWESEDAE